MNFYNMLFGVDKIAGPLLGILGVSAADIPRFRDCFLDGNKIVIYTRTGGGNREAYVYENDTLRTIPGFLFDRDDEFDHTYASFYYEIPNDYKEKLSNYQKYYPTVLPHTKFEELLKTLQREKA